MRRYQLFAAGVSVALLLGAGTPAFAKPGKAVGHQKEPAATRPAKGPKDSKPPKTPKATKHAVTGGGAIATGEFSVQAKSDSKAKGHFNYTATDGTMNIRCRGFDPYTPTMGATSSTASITFKNCRVTGKPDGQTVVVTVTDNGQPKREATPPVTDRIGFSVNNADPAIAVADAPLTDGNVKVR